MARKAVPEDDAWKQHMDLVDRFSTRVKVREDLVVEALGVDRAVRFTLKIANLNARGPIDRWRSYDSGTRNVSTMRELAKALNDACDFVEAANPIWADRGRSIQ